MTHSTRLGLAPLLVLALACNPASKSETAGVGAGAAMAGLSAADESAVRAVDAAWTAAANAGDANALAGLYTADATLLPPGEQMHKGDIAKYWAGMTDANTVAIQLSTSAVEGQGDLAYAVGTYTLTLTPKTAGAKPMPTEEGKYVEIMKKQADGSWKIVYDMWSPSAKP
jgi:uncharacterized protein (TIGR02246 family)